MPDALCTVQDAATQLKVHPKTVLRFIRDGRLRATRIGRAYRIPRAELEKLAGAPVRATSSSDEPWITTIVDVPSVGSEAAKKWARTITNALRSKPPGSIPLRAEVVYEPERMHLKIILTGAPGDAVNLLNLIRVWLEQLTP